MSGICLDLTVTCRAGDDEREELSVSQNPSPVFPETILSVGMSGGHGESHLT